MFELGSFVEFDGLLGGVVGLEGEGGVPEDHLAVWFGEPQGVRRSEGGSGGLTPVVWTVTERILPARQRSGAETLIFRSNLGTDRFWNEIEDNLSG